MTRLQLLLLAREGAKEKLAYEANKFTLTRANNEVHIEGIRKALAEYDDIVKQIEECRKEE